MKVSVSLYDNNFKCRQLTNINRLQSKKIEELQQNIHKIKELEEKLDTVSNLYQSK